MRTDISLSIFILLCISIGNCYKILSVLPYPFRSHWIIGSAVTIELAKAGHEVTLVSPFHLKQPNVTNIVLENIPAAFSNPFELFEVPPLQYFIIMPGLVEKYLHLVLSNPDVQKLQQTESFDVVVVEVFASEALYVELSSAVKILAVFPMDWKSHFFIARSVLKTLADRGHNITFISPYKLDYPGISSVILDNRDGAQFDAFLLAEFSLYKNFIAMAEITDKNIDLTLSHPSVQKILKEERFDAVIVEIFASEALYALGNHFNCPVIGVTTFGVSEWSNVITNSPNPTSYNPNVFTPYTEHMTFLERFDNTFVWWMEEILWHFYNYPMQEQIYEKYLKKDSNSLRDIIHNVSLILNNQHFTSTSVKPTMPNVIDIGGITVDPVAKDLPENIKEFLDSATDGAIVFSMGSIIQAVQWPVEKREAFVRAFGKLKQKVLWKYENDTLPNKPSNVMISKWLPQRDVLAHPNVKLFIGHGGLLGTTEAMYEGVPILAIPIFGDQKMNMKMARDKGFCFMLDFNNLNEKIISEALENALKDDKIQKKAKEYSKMFRDRPLTPQESVVYWVEYVIRYQGANLLKSAAKELSYIALHNIDVYATFISVIFLIFYMKYKIIQFAVKLVMSKPTKEKNQ